MATYYLGKLKYISTEIYRHLPDWESKMAFSTLNRGSREIAFENISRIAYDLNDIDLDNKASNLAVCTASTFRLTDISNIKNEYIVRLRGTCPNCSTLIVDTVKELPLNHLKLFAKACAKYKFRVVVASSPQATTFTSIIEHYTHRKVENITVIAEKNVNKRKATYTIEAPVDPKRRMLFYLDKVKQLAEHYEDRVCDVKLDLPQKLQHYIDGYQDYSLLDPEQLPPVQFSSDHIGSYVESLASKLVGSVVKFNDMTFFITSGDVFIHNHALLDDCSTGITKAEYHSKPTALIKQKQFMSNTKFYELSIFYGFFEFLVVGCIYHDNKDGLVRGCLGSSLQDWKGEASLRSNLMYTPAVNKEWMHSPRQLRNYLRRDSHRLWGFHLMSEYISGFTPMIAIDFGNHASQVNKPANIHHAASKLLNVCTMRGVTTKEDVQLLFRVFSSLRIGLQQDERPSTFEAMKNLLSSGRQQHKYFTFLVDVAAFVESRVERLKEAHIYQELLILHHADWPLKIMNDGLKVQMKKDRGKVVKDRIRH